MVLELSDKHPAKLPGLPAPANYKDLPKEYHAIYPAPKDLPAGARKALGKWPDFAIAVTEAVRAKEVKPAPPQLGPSHAADFPAPIKQFVDTTLRAKLSGKEITELENVEGRWPEYPRAVLELAGKHGLDVPLMKLPDADKWWEKVRNAPPEVPDRALRDFALNDLTPEERTNLKLSVTDPTSRDRLVQEYFKKNPHERKRLEHLDHQQLLNRGPWPPPKPKPGL
jgi:hypothetical protein